MCEEGEATHLHVPAVVESTCAAIGGSWRRYLIYRAPMKMERFFIIVVLFIACTNVDSRKIITSGNAGIGLHLPEFSPKNDVPKKNIPFSFRASLDFLHNTCVKESKQVEQFLSDSHFLNHIQTIGKDICKTLPYNSRGKCEEISKMYIQDAFTMFQNYYNEERLCISTGLCLANYRDDFYEKMNKGGEASSVDASDDTTCEICEQFTQEVTYYLAQNTTQIMILNAFHHACSNLNVFGCQCKSLVDYYGPLFFVEVAMVSPEELCEKINLCSSTVPHSARRQQNNCDLCEQALTELKSKFENPETEIKLIKVLLNACKYVPNYVKECKLLVFEYGPLIFATVEKYLDANDLCSKIHMCRSTNLYIEMKKSGPKSLIGLLPSEFQVHRGTQ